MTPLWLPPLKIYDLPETRGEDGQHHLGCMITQKRAAIVAAQLFPSDVAVEADCQRGCRHCTERRSDWQDRVSQVRWAMLEAFK